MSHLPWQRLLHKLCRLLGQALDSFLLGCNEKKRATHSVDLCNSRIIHEVSLSLLLFQGDVDSQGVRPYNFMVYQLYRPDHSQWEKRQAYSVLEVLKHRILQLENRYFCEYVKTYWTTKAWIILRHLISGSSVF